MFSLQVNIVIASKNIGVVVAIVKKRVKSDKMASNTK